MDTPSPTPSQDRPVSEAPRLHRYGAHGPWPVVLAILLLIKFGWCAKLYYSLVRGDLAGTPAQRFHNTLLINLGVIFIEILSYPGMQVLSRARNFPWPSSPPMFFAQAFMWSMNDAAICIMAFICLHRLPSTIPPDTPGYDPSAFREYRAWRSVDLPLLAMLNMFSAVAIVVDCATWMYWDFERERRVRRITELRDLRMRRMFGRRDRHEDMVTGVVQEGEAEGPKEREDVLRLRGV